MLTVSELSAVAIRDLLFADVLADLFQFEPNRRSGIALDPETLPREVRSLPYSRAMAIALFPLRNPITKATGGMAMHMCA